MPSHLRLQAPFEPVSMNVIYHVSPTLPPAKKQKMSLTQTYYVASSARSKLGREANRADHNLRRLVGHANLLDSLMLELSSAEQEQERWFHASVQKASKPEQPPQHIQWADTIPEQDDETSDDDDESDAGSDYDEDADDIFTILPRRMRSPPLQTAAAPAIAVDDELGGAADADDDNDDHDDDDEQEVYDDDDAEAAGLTLQRVPSGRHSPPELMDDASDSESEDESPPASPETAACVLDDKQRHAMTATPFYDAPAPQAWEDYILHPAPLQASHPPPHPQHPPPLIAAY